MDHSKQLQCINRNNCKVLSIVSLLLKGDDPNELVLAWSMKSLKSGLVSTLSTFCIMSAQSADLLSADSSRLCTGATSAY